MLHIPKLDDVLKVFRGIFQNISGRVTVAFIAFLLAAFFYFFLRNVAMFL